MKRWLLLLPFVAVFVFGESEFLNLATAEFFDKVAEVYGPEGRGRVESWFRLLREARADSASETLAQLNSANDFFNQVSWLSDEKHWGESDYWATPIETLASNGGDCEDFAVGKYFSLVEMNLDKEKLRITYVKSLTYNQAHMVLAYYPTPEAEPLILDNINKTILPASQRQDLIPIYSFNGDSIWLVKARGEKLEANSMQGLPQWRDLHARMAVIRKARN